MVSERLNSLESSHAVESERTRIELTRLRGAEEEAKNNANRVNTLLEELERLKKELHTTQKEKKTIEDWAQKYRDEMEKVSPPSAPALLTAPLSSPLLPLSPLLLSPLS